MTPRCVSAPAAASISGHQRKREKRVEADERPEPKCRKHGEHEKLAVREVDDLHQPKNQAEPDRNEGIDEPHQQAGDQGLDDQVARHRCLPARP